MGIYEETREKVDQEPKRPRENQMTPAQTAEALKITNCRMVDDAVATEYITSQVPNFTPEEIREAVTANGDNYWYLTNSIMNLRGSLGVLQSKLKDLEDALKQRGRELGILPTEPEPPPHKAPSPSQN